MPMVTLHVNGTPRAVDLGDPEMPLVFVLRDLLGLLGTKIGCTEGVCGVCTVHVDGVATRSCQVRATDLAGAAIRTIEGLSADASHPVQRAWIENDVPQCGYCQSGQIMRAAALLAERPTPTAGEIGAAMADVLCRCGTYPAIRRAIVRAAALARPAGAA